MNNIMVINELTDINKTLEENSENYSVYEMTKRINFIISRLSEDERTKAFKGDRKKGLKAIARECKKVAKKDCGQWAQLAYTTTTQAEGYYVSTNRYFIAMTTETVQDKYISINPEESHFPDCMKIINSVKTNAYSDAEKLNISNIDIAAKTKKPYFEIQFKGTDTFKSYFDPVYLTMALNALEYGKNYSNIIFKSCGKVKPAIMENVKTGELFILLPMRILEGGKEL